MTRDKKKYKLDDKSINQLIYSSKILNLATISKNGIPHLVPMWFVLDDQLNINFTSYYKSQKIVNLKRDNRIVVMVESGIKYQELKGITIEGIAKMDSNKELILQTVNSITAKYGVNRTASDIDNIINKRVNVKIIPKKITTWDLSKS
ncbi:MAG: pyridoxamine 5'-phosphate oxidase family protein [Dehalococcoidia bacterium]|nr:pyridoxamine 5'-phosphate oxidase family protein [Dehalococcoidia bacterium]